MDTGGTAFLMCVKMNDDLRIIVTFFIAVATIILNYIMIHKVHHLIFNNKCHYRFELNLCAGVYMLHKNTHKNKH